VILAGVRMLPKIVQFLGFDPTLQSSYFNATTRAANRITNTEIRALPAIRPEARSGPLR